jgi:hypothetical protein
MKNILQLLDIYQNIKNGYTFDEDISYNYMLTLIREKLPPKNDKHLRDEFWRIY